MKTNDNFFGGPATFSFRDDVRIGKWCGGMIVPPEPFTQNATKYKTNEPDFWDAEKTRPKQQLQVTIDTTMGKVPERADANDPGLRRLFVRDAGDLNKAVKQAILAAGARKMEIGGQLYICNTGKRVNDQGGNDARTFTAVYAPPDASSRAQVMAKHGSGVAPEPQAQVLNIDDVPKAPAPGWQPSAPAAPAPAAPAFPAAPQYQPTTYSTGAQPVAGLVAPSPDNPTLQQQFGVPGAAVPLTAVNPVGQQPSAVPPGVDPAAYAAFLASQQAPAAPAPTPAAEQSNPFAMGAPAAPLAYQPPAAPPMPQYGVDPAAALPQAQYGQPSQVPPPAWASQPAQNQVPPNPLS